MPSFQLVRPDGEVTDPVTGRVPMGTGAREAWACLLQRLDALAPSAWLGGRRLSAPLSGIGAGHGSERSQACCRQDSPGRWLRLPGSVSGQRPDSKLRDQGQVLVLAAMCIPQSLDKHDLDLRPSGDSPEPRMPGEARGPVRNTETALKSACLCDGMKYSYLRLKYCIELILVDNEFLNRFIFHKLLTVDPPIRPP